MQGGLLGSRAPQFRQTPQLNVAGAVQQDYQRALSQQPQGGGGLGSILGLASLFAAPFTGGGSLGIGSLFGAAPSAQAIGQIAGSALVGGGTGPFLPPAQAGLSRLGLLF